ncbi:MAG TPA: dTDP-4-dehydrorhamnose reductase [Saprospiraceae bacterium]|nr:dTDP-4-dehydrorhamnose reductase [Saprospiraceae bacterium]
MKKILVTGGDGQVGMELQNLQPHYPGFTFRFTDAKDLDITDSVAIHDYFDDFRPDYVFNCAAFTAVDKAEEAVDIALKVNALGAEILAKAAQKYQSKMFHISTDYVYDSSQNTPYIEGDSAHPGGIYAITKYLGDKAVLDALPSAIILRTSWVYSSYGHNFVKSMQKFGQERDQLNIVYDQIGTPTYAHDLAKAMMDIAQKFENKELDAANINGVFHYSNEGVASWYDFAMAIFELDGITCDVRPILSKEYPTPARRPPFSLMDKGKFKSTFGLTIPYWRESLKTCLQEIRK